MVSKVKNYPEIQIPSPVTQTWNAYKESPLAMIGFWGMVVLLLVVIAIQRRLRSTSESTSPRI